MPTDWRDENRRSLQAWLRTGLTLVIVGALITGASLAVGPATSADRMLPWIGVTLAVVGVISNLGAVVRYRLARLRGGRRTGASEAAARVLVGLIVIAGSLLVIILIADAC